MNNIINFYFINYININNDINKYNNNYNITIKFINVMVKVSLDIF